MRRVVLLLFAACGRYGFSDGDAGSATGVQLQIDAPGLSVAELTARFTFASLDPDQLYAIPATGGPPALPTSTRFGLPDASGSLVATVEALDTTGRRFVATGVADIVARHDATIAITIGAALAPSCLDGVRDGDETDVDCGGSCVPCAVGGACKASTDCATAACVAGTCEPASGPPFWQPIAAMATARIGLGAVLASDGQIYVFGGGADDNVQTAEADAYDPANDVWSLLPPLGSGRNRLAGAVDGNGAVYAIGGTINSAAKSTVERFVPGTAAWQTVAALPGSCYALAASTTGGTVYAVGGDTGAADVGTLAGYTGTSWAVQAAMPTVRSNLAAAPDTQGRILAVGGHDYAETIYYTTAEAYDPSSGSWATLPAMHHGRSDLAAVLGADGRTYSLGGYVVSVGPQTYVEAYRPGAAAWVDVAPLGTPRDTPAAAVGPEGRIYIFGGRTATALASAEAYGPHFTLASASGSAGDAIAIAGSNFAAKANVRIYVDAVPVELALSDASGGLPAGAAFHVPALAAGPHVVRAIDDRSQYPVTAAFTVR